MANPRLPADAGSPNSSSTARHDRHTVRFLVTADICPQVLLRILGLISQRDMIPTSVYARRRPRHLRIELALDGVALPAATILLHKIAAIVGVRSARLLRQVRAARSGPAVR